MTGIFDFVRDMGWYIDEHPDMENLVRAVLLKTVHVNKSKNFKNWFEAYGHYKKIDTWDIKKILKFYDNFHDIDHRYHHKVFCDTSHSILYQFSKLFRDYRILKRENYIHVRSIMTLKKHVPLVIEYLEKYYVKRYGLYNLKVEEEESNE